MNNKIISKFSLCFSSKTETKTIAKDLTFSQIKPIAALIEGAVIKFYRMEVQS